MLLTDVIIFPNVAQHDISSQEHGNATNATLLHMDVLIEVSFMSCGRMTWVNTVIFQYKNCTLIWLSGGQTLPLRTAPTSPLGVKSLVPSHEKICPSLTSISLFSARATRREKMLLLTSVMYNGLTFRISHSKPPNLNPSISFQYGFSCKEKKRTPFLQKKHKTMLTFHLVQLTLATDRTCMDQVLER